MLHRRAALLLPLLSACAEEQLADPAGTLRARWERRRGVDLDDGVHEFNLPDGRVRATQRGFTTIVEITPARGGFDRAVVEGIFLRQEISPAGRALLRETGNPRMIEIAGLRPRRFDGAGQVGD
jgi:hypothetical protein